MKSRIGAGRLVLCTLITLCLALSACASKSSPESVLRALVEAEKGRVGGSIYFLSADEGENGYISDTAFASIYGFDRTLDGLSEGAIYLSDFCHPVELAVFLCNSTYAAEDIAVYLKGRIKTLYESASESARFSGINEDEYREYIRSAEVIVSGRYVALIISSDAREAKRIFCREV